MESVTRPWDGTFGVHKMRSRDTLDHSRQLPGWTLECIQLTPGVFDGRITDIRLDHIQILREVTNQAMIKRGSSWPGSIVVSIPLAASGQGWLRGHQLPDGVGLLADGGDLPDLCTPTRLDLVCLTCCRAWLLQRAVAAGHDRVAQLIGRSVRLSIPAAHRHRIGDQVLAAMTAIERRPSILADGEERRAIEDNLLQVLFEGLAAVDSDGLAPETPRKRIADQIRSLVLEDPSQTPNLADICRRMEISRAHLQNCFRLSYGMTATQLLRAVRLHRVRNELRLAREAGRSPSIGDVAARWGFWHWSRFAIDYRRHFGELPSTTLGSGRRAGEAGRYAARHPGSQDEAVGP